MQINLYKSYSTLLTIIPYFINNYSFKIYPKNRLKKRF